MNLSDRNRWNIGCRWKKIHNIEKDRINEDYLILSRLCGFLAGDGSLIIRKEKSREAMRYNVRFYPDDLELVDLFVDSFEKVYSKIPHVKKLKNHFRVSITSKVATLHLDDVASFGTMDWDVPGFVLNSKEYVVEFVRAFYDCEGYVGKNRVDVQSVNKEGLLQIKKLLSELEIDSNFYTYERKNPNWNTNYILVISGKENIINFARFIGFNHSVKRVKLNKIAGVA